MFEKLFFIYFIYPQKRSLKKKIKKKFFFFLFLFFHKKFILYQFVLQITGHSMYFHSINYETFTNFKYTFINQLIVNLYF